MPATRPGGSRDPLIGGTSGGLVDPGFRRDADGIVARVIPPSSKMTARYTSFRKARRVQLTPG